MAKLSTYALAGALALALAPAAARAADLPEPPALEPVEPVEFGSAWYLRGDAGYKIYNNPNVKYFGDKFHHVDLDDTGVIGGGVGYKFNSWLRADVTLDYEFKSDFDGRLTCRTTACGGEDSTLFSREHAKISAWTPMANVYADLGNWHGVVPYVGGGLGASRIKVSGYDYVNPNGVRGSQPGGKDWSFSWALMAGVGYTITENLIIDAGYRFLDLGDVKSKVSTGAGGKVKFDDIHAHEFRVGFRYLIN